LASGVTDTSVPPDWRFPVKHLHQMHLLLQIPAKDSNTKTVAAR